MGTAHKQSIHTALLHQGQENGTTVGVAGLQGWKLGESAHLVGHGGVGHRIGVGVVVTMLLVVFETLVTMSDATPDS